MVNRTQRGEQDLPKVNRTGGEQEHTPNGSQTWQAGPKYFFLWVYEQPHAQDTGLFFPKAIQHVFVGLYVQQLCLAALFFLATDKNKRANAAPRGCAYGSASRHYHTFSSASGVLNLIYLRHSTMSLSTTLMARSYSRFH